MKNIFLLLKICLFSHCFFSCQDSLLDTASSEHGDEKTCALSQAEGTISRIIADGSTINGKQYGFLLQSLYYLEARYPELEKVIEFIMNNRGPIMFKMNNNLAGDAAYNSHTIEFSNDYHIEPERLLEEILHATQDILYGYYNMQNAIKNVEFEARVLRDIWERKACEKEGIAPNCRGCAYHVEEYQQEYSTWIFSLSIPSLQSFPLQEFNTRTQTWYDPGYLYAVFNPSFHPQLITMFSF